MAEDYSELIRQVDSDSVYCWGQNRFNRDGRSPTSGPREAWALQQEVALHLAQGRLVVHDVNNSTIGRNELAHHVLGASTVSWSREIFEAATDTDFQGAIHGKPEGEASASFWVLDSLVETSALSVLAFALIRHRPDRILIAPIGGLTPALRRSQSAAVLRASSTENTGPHLKGPGNKPLKKTVYRAIR